MSLRFSSTTRRNAPLTRRDHATTTTTHGRPWSHLKNLQIFMELHRFEYLVSGFPVLPLPVLPGSNKKGPPGKPGGLLILEIIPTKKPPNVSGGASGKSSRVYAYTTSPRNPTGLGQEHRQQQLLSFMTSILLQHIRFPHASFLRTTLITGSPLSREEPTRQPPNRPESSRVPDPRSGPGGGVPLVCAKLPWRLAKVQPIMAPRQRPRADRRGR